MRLHGWRCLPPLTAGVPYTPADPAAGGRNRSWPRILRGWLGYGVEAARPPPGATVLRSHAQAADLHDQLLHRCGEKRDDPGVVASLHLGAVEIARDGVRDDL